jgi:hypothetical protein
MHAAQRRELSIARDSAEAPRKEPLTESRLLLTALGAAA